MSKPTKGKADADPAKRPLRAATRAGEKAGDSRRTVERVQTGVRMERRILGVLKALADLHDISLGDLLEGIVLHAFEGKGPFSPESLAKIQALKQVFGLDLGAADSHLLVEPSGPKPAASRKNQGGKSS